MRLASWNICMFVAFEQLKRAFMRVPALSGVPETVTSPPELVQARASG